MDRSPDDNEPPPGAIAHGDQPYQRETLWILLTGPTIWAVHFLMSYVTAAVWCAKVGGNPVAVRWTVAVYTALALAGVVFFFFMGWRQHTTGEDEPVPHKEPTPGDRHRFIGYSTCLLCGLSAVAILFDASVVLYFDSCR